MGWLNAVYYFLVGDMRILIGTLIALGVAASSVMVSPSVAGILLFGLLAATLALSLRHEVTP
jgi:hypothetical protein